MQSGEGVIMEELLSQLILNGVESEYLDFKAEQYSDKVSLSWYVVT